jgi:hypothetical protein
VAHPALYHATYLGPEPVATVGEGLAARGYPAGQTVQVGEADAEAIRSAGRQDFELERVPEELIGTAEETQPTDPVEAALLHRRLAEIAERG